jgi:hypothetical protein
VTRPCVHERTLLLSVAGGWIMRIVRIGFVMGSLLALVAPVAARSVERPAHDPSS